MGTRYLVDYENVSHHGLQGLRDLPEEDTVYLFYTVNANQIGLDALERMKAKLQVIRVSPGKQSLDMHLSSWLGNLLGREGSPDDLYVIVSKDTDFDGIIGFWRKEYQNNQKIVRRGAIDPNAPELDPACPEKKPADPFEVIHREIMECFRNYSEKDSAGKSRLAVSRIFSRLNHVSAYNTARKNSGKKPRNFLRDKFSDTVVLKNLDGTEWAYLASEIGTAEAEEQNAADIPEETPETETPEQNQEPETVPVIEEAEPAAEITAENNVPDNEDAPADSAEPEDHPLPEPEPRKQEIAEEPAASEQKDDPEISEKLIQAGFETEIAEYILPIIEECLKAKSPKTMLCKQLRHVYGSKTGNEYYKTVRDALAL